MLRLSEILKNTLLLLILIYVAPLLIHAIKKQYHALLEQKTKVGVITINGSISEAEPYIQALTQLCKDPEIKAILLRIHCPGGHPGAAQALYSEIKALKKEYSKTIGTYIENIATSCGYYIACSTDFIVATPAAFVGNIGALDDILLDKTETGTRMLQSLTNEIYHQFTNDIVRVRPKLISEKSSEWAEGKTFTGAKALELGLIDAVGSPSTAEELLRKYTPIDGDIEWVTEPHSDSCAYTFLRYCIRFLKKQSDSVT